MAGRHPAEDPKKADPGDTLLVIHAFEARSPDELSLTKGDRIELVEKDDDFGDGWYLGKHLADGRTGLFPEVYTKIAPPDTYADGRPRTTSNAAAGPPPPGMMNPPSSQLDGAVTHTQTVNAPYPQAQGYQAAPLNTAPVTQQRTVSVPTSAFASPTVSSAPPTQRSISMMMEGGRQIDEQSPVINETLSVIDEHITDMNSSPHAGTFAHDTRPLANNQGINYAQPGARFSYIHGDETDEEERNQYNAAEVGRWSSRQVAEFLEEIGVEKHHCDVFQEQEITGEVLLNMDQASIFMKEFDLGTVGRRLRTWQKIQAFQTEVSALERKTSVKRSQSNRTPASDAPGAIGQATSSEARHIRQGSPLAESFTHDSSRGSIRGPPSIGARESPLRTSFGGYPVDARRQSSLEAQSKRSQPQLRESLPAAPSPNNHNKKPSFDRNWTMSSSGSPAPNRSSFLGVSSRSQAASTIDLESGSEGARDLDRGYLSGSEVDGRKHRNVLRKRDTAGSSHSRQSSYKEASPQTLSTSTAATTTNKRHSRFGSAGSFINAITSVGRTPDESNNAKTIDQGKETQMIGGSPIVTRLDYDSPRDTLTSTKRESRQPESSRSSLNQSLGSKPLDQSSGRADDKTSLSSTLVTSPREFPVGKDNSIVSPTRTTSTSGASKSTEQDQNKNKTPTSATAPASAKQRVKNKKQTSAYTRGLLKVPPREAMAQCDYSGWMKKKSPSLIATWKPRLFVLRGRRLSYYYTEDDTEEQGLIDISNHKVLPADDLLTGIHATVTGAKSTPTSPLTAQTTTMNAAEVAAQIESTLKRPAHENTFIFKLVPPRTGLSRAVNFTKPTVHYFAVDNIRQGRLWMAALMKATIQMDTTKAMVTTYSQKTISLAKAQQMKQRPPNLQDVNEDGEERRHDDDDDVTDDGLKIQGLDMSYEYLATGVHRESSTNGARDSDDEHSGGKSSIRASAPHNQSQSSLRMVRSLSGGLSHQERGDDESDRLEPPGTDFDRGSRPSTSASKHSQGSRLRARSTHTPGTAA